MCEFERTDIRIMLTLGIRVHPSSPLHIFSSLLSFSVFCDFSV